MPFRVTMPETDEIRTARNKAARDAARKDVEELLDGWCESIESAARNNCDDLDGKRIKFYRQGMDINGDCSDPDSADCLRAALEGRMDTMDTALTGVYELVLEQLESHKKSLFRSAPRATKRR